VRFSGATVAVWVRCSLLHPHNTRALLLRGNASYSDSTKSRDGHKSDGNRVKVLRIVVVQCRDAPRRVFLR
jgi:hypothetical protein